MKALNVTKTLTTIAVMATISFSSIVRADEISLPVISKPAILEEGTQRSLTKDQIAELLPWAKNSKIFLNDLLDNIQGLSTSDKIDRLVEGISNTVGESAPKNSELLMRYALNRGLALNDILSKEMSDDVVGTQDAKLRVLKSSIQIALKYYETDMASLSAKSIAPYVIFGLDYFNFLNELNKSIFDASAQYAIQRTALEWLQWDLYRDLNNASYAPQIVKINNSLKTFPVKKLTDAQSIAFIRQMKAVAGQLKVDETLKKLTLDKQLAQAKNEEARQAIIRRQQEDADRAEQARQAAEDAKNGIVRPVMTVAQGDLVAYSNTIRTVEYITDNGQVVLKETSDYNRTISTSSNVVKLFNSYGKYSKGASVAYSGTLRKIEFVGANGLVVLAESNDYNRTFVMSNLIALGVSSYGKFKNGDKVLYSNQLRVIETCTDTGLIILAETEDYNRSFVMYNALSKVL